MINEHGVNAVKVRRADLLTTVKKNREAHRQTYDRAMAGYRKAAIKTLTSMLSDAKSGGEIRSSIELEAPISQLREYDRAIRSLEMSVDNLISLNDTEFKNYVMDDWSWTDHVASTNAMYIGKALKRR